MNDHTLKITAVLSCAVFAAGILPLKRKVRIHDEILQTIEKHCDSEYPCKMSFDELPAGWETLTISPWEEYREIDVETTRDRALLFKNSKGLDHAVVERGDVLLIARRFISPDRSFYEVEVVPE